jgi:glycosyltransferase involved in cell wall biosynthesis
VHGYVPFELQLNKTIRPPVSWLVNAEFRLSLHWFDEVVVFSEYMKNLLSRHVPIDRIHVLPLGVNVQDYRQRRRSAHGADLKILFLGRMVSVKGIDVLVTAISMLNKNNLRTTTHIVGDGPLLPKIRALIEQLDLADRVKLCGIVTEETKRNLLASFDVLVVPSIYEPIPTVILEAFAAGVPVIASDVGGIPELVRHGFNGFLTKAGDAKDLANAISILAKDARLRRRLALNAMRYVNRHDWSHVVDSYIAFYEQVLSKQH